jgi:hypothetical protein
LAFVRTNAGVSASREQEGNKIGTSGDGRGVKYSPPSTETLHVDVRSVVERKGDEFGAGPSRQALERRSTGTFTMNDI